MTAAQRALAQLLQVPPELLMTVALHSSDIPKQTTKDDFAAWVELLPQKRRSDYLVRLARNEPGLSRLLIKELRELGQPANKADSTENIRIAYSTLLAESKRVKEKYERAKREEEQRARLQHMKNIHDHQSDYWYQADQAAIRKTSTGYDEATRLLVELREVAEYFHETEEFQKRFRNWLIPHSRRPALLQRLRDRKFPFPEAPEV
ncbi:hypothetical protein [Dictyobacter kobayashii]|uniref:hypothetical protein n=1 Tax=Dictyobacter kobayashii TaxID=2014872 RepID=UPI001FEAEACB|nr:hypothetical protein [Dictyobacter kobayashii]